MKSSLKFTHYLTVLSSLMILESTIAESKTCPVLNKTELKQLCRWKLLSKIPGVKAGQVTVEGTTLVNKLGSCGESDSVKAFFNTDPSKTYEGVATKDPTDVNNPSKALCTYDIETLRGKNRAIAFEVTFAPEVSMIQPKKGPKITRGVDITSSPNTQTVEIKKGQDSQKPAPTFTPPVTSPTVSTGRPVPPAPMMQPKQPPLAASPAFSGTETDMPGSKPPSRKPPAAPTQPAADLPSSKTTPSNAAARDMMFQDEEFKKKMNERKLRNTEGE